jgi:hypothetical protein
MIGKRVTGVRLLIRDPGCTTFTDRRHAADDLDVWMRI